MILFRNPRYFSPFHLNISKVEGGKTSDLLQWLDIVSGHFCFVGMDSTASVPENNAQLEKDGRIKLERGLVTNTFEFDHWLYKIHCGSNQRASPSWN